MQGKKFSKSIIRISVISIALAIIVNLITISIVKGFQNQVRDKVTGFGSHLSIFLASEKSIYESDPILKDQSFFNEIKQHNAIKSISPVGYKPVLLQSEKTEKKIKLSNEQDSIIFEQNVHGALLKGVNANYDWDFFKKYLVQGEIPQFTAHNISHEILISSKIAELLNFNVGDTVRSYFVKTRPVLKNLIISGIYKTGLEEHDKKIIVADLGLVQGLNDWGIKASINIDDTLFHMNGYQDQLIVRVNATGGQGIYRYDWGEGFESYNAKLLATNKDTVIKVVVSDYTTHFLEKKSTTIPDTVILKIDVSGDEKSINQFQVDDFGYLIKNYKNSSGTKYEINSTRKKVHVELINGKGSSQNYISGFELKVNQWGELNQIEKKIKSIVEFNPSTNNELFKVQNIKEAERNIFVWLGFLDINVLIILVLMILIGIINMGSAMLVLILIRTNFIGILKSLGATNWSVRKIFLYLAARLIVKGMIIGNVIGLSLALIQQNFGIIKLNPEVYYLDIVPIELSLLNWFVLNLGTFIICVLALILPSLIITKISPVKALKFD